MTTVFSTSEVYIRNTRVSFARTSGGGSTRDERIVFTPDVSGYSLFLGLSSLISTATDDSLQKNFPGKAAFTFDVVGKRFGIGGISSPQYALDISSTTGIRVSGGGQFIGPAQGLLSVPTAALFSTLPTSVFAPGSIPLDALTSTGTVLVLSSVAYFKEHICKVNVLNQWKACRALHPINK
jgi:hypothetical protein